MGYLHVCGGERWKPCQLAAAIRRVGPAVLRPPAWRTEYQARLWYGADGDAGALLLLFAAGCPFGSRGLPAGVDHGMVSAGDCDKARFGRRAVWPDRECTGRNHVGWHRGSP